MCALTKSGTTVWPGRRRAGLHGADEAVADDDVAAIDGVGAGEDAGVGESEVVGCHIGSYKAG